MKEGVGHILPVQRRNAFALSCNCWLWHSYLQDLEAPVPTSTVQKLRKREVPFSIHSLTPLLSIKFIYLLRRFVPYLSFLHLNQHYETKVVYGQRVFGNALNKVKHISFLQNMLKCLIWFTLLISKRRLQNTAFTKFVFLSTLFS